MVNAACIDVGQLMNITVILLFMQCPPINELLGSVRNEGIRQTMSSLAFLTFQVRTNYIQGLATSPCRFLTLPLIS